MEKSAAEERALLAEGSPRLHLEAMQAATAALALEKAAADARALAAEARAEAAEAAAAEALAEVQRVREDEARHQAECESLRAMIRAIRQAGQCPIRHSLCEDPVVASDGQTYERRGIEPWLIRHGTSPITREPLEPHLYPNRFATAVLQQLQELGMGRSEASLAGDEDRSARHRDAEDDGSEDREMVVEDRDEAEEETDARPGGAIRDAIERRDEAAALRILRRRRVPGLNDRDPDGGTVLHRAVTQQFSEVALAILTRMDFREVNAQGGADWTALHAAAFHGLLPVCRALLARRDFVEQRAISVNGLTAAQVAQQYGHLAVAEFLGVD